METSTTIVPSPTPARCSMRLTGPGVDGSYTSPSRIRASRRPTPTSGQGAGGARLGRSRVPYAVLRPAILFGGDGVLLEQPCGCSGAFPFSAWVAGEYRIRPVHIDDLASLAVAAGAERTDTVVDAVGPERVAFLDLVKLIREVVGSRSVILRIAEWRRRPAGNTPRIRAITDVLLTGDEFRAMAAGLADTDGQATGTTAVTSWIREHAIGLGRSYGNEIERHFRR